MKGRSPATRTVRPASRREDTGDLGEERLRQGQAGLDHVREAVDRIDEVARSVGEIREIAPAAAAHGDARLAGAAPPGDLHHARRDVDTDDLLDLRGDRQEQAADSTPDQPPRWSAERMAKPG